MFFEANPRKFSTKAWYFPILFIIINILPSGCVQGGSSVPTGSSDTSYQYNVTDSPDRAFYELRRSLIDSGVYLFEVCGDGKQPGPGLRGGYTGCDDELRRIDKPKSVDIAKDAITVRGIFEHIDEHGRVTENEVPPITMEWSEIHNVTNEYAGHVWANVLVFTTNSNKIYAMQIKNSTAARKNILTSLHSYLYWTNKH